MSESCHLNGAAHSWECIDVLTQQYWCRDCGALGHRRADTKEMEWEAPRVHRGHPKPDPATGFLKGLLKPNRFEREDPTE